MNSKTVNKTKRKIIDRNSNTNKIPSEEIVQMAVAKDNSKLKVIKVHGKLRCSINQKNLIYHQNQLTKVGKTVNRSEVVVEEVAATNDTKQIAIRIQNKDLLQIKVHVVVMKLGVKINTIDLRQIKAKEGVATSDTKQIESRI